MGVFQLGLPTKNGKMELYPDVIPQDLLNSSSLWESVSCSESLTEPRKESLSRNLQEPICFTWKYLLGIQIKQKVIP